MRADGAPVPEVALNGPGAIGEGGEDEEGRGEEGAEPGRRARAWKVNYISILIHSGEHAGHL